MYLQELFSSFARSDSTALTDVDFFQQIFGLHFKEKQFFKKWERISYVRVLRIGFFTEFSTFSIPQLKTFIPRRLPPPVRGGVSHVYYSFVYCRYILPSFPSPFLCPQVWPFSPFLHVDVFFHFSVITPSNRVSLRDYDTGKRGKTMWIEYRRIKQYYKHSINVHSLRCTCLGCILIFQNQLHAYPWS